MRIILFFSFLFFATAVVDAQDAPSLPGNRTQKDSLQKNNPRKDSTESNSTQKDSTLQGVLVVSSTRTGESLENSTIRVEVLGSEEMQEESLVKPGSVASILGDVSGVQVQQSSAASGNTNVRILGLDGKYTQLLRDGMPIYDGFSGGFGVLSIQPLDLQQLELIKGSSSTLYGGGAIGGLINFISRKPAYQPEASFILNQSTRNETNVNAWLAARSRHWGYTLFLGQTWQHQVDVNHDGLSELPQLNSTVIHPTLFCYPSNKTIISLGWSGSFEKRKGGDMIAIGNHNVPDHPYFENNDLERNTVALISETRLSPRYVLHAKGTYSSFRRMIGTNTEFFRGKQANVYGEVSANAKLKRHIVVAGVNITGDYFRPSVETPAQVGNVKHTSLGLFMQDTWSPVNDLRLETGLRIDRQCEYGTFVLPRVALLYKPGRSWGVRAGYGLGYKTPNPLTPQIRDYDVFAIRPLPADIRAESSAGINIEVNYKVTWGEDNSLLINHAFFYTGIRHAVIGEEQANGDLAFSNAGRRIITRGTDTYVQLKIDDLEFYLGYTFTDARRRYLASDQFMPLTPKNRAASTLVYEPDEAWRFGVEASWNSRQTRDDDNDIRGYCFMAAMISRKIGKKISVVLNVENLLDQRQSRYESLYTGSIATPLFRVIGTPLDGRVFNVAVRLSI